MPCPALYVLGQATIRKLGELAADLKIPPSQPPTGGSWGGQEGALAGHPWSKAGDFQSLDYLSGISNWTILIYRATISPSAREVGLGRNRKPEARCGAAARWWGNHSCCRAAQSVLEISGDQVKARPREDVMVMTTPAVRRQLKIIAAVTGSTMKDVLERLVGEEFKRVTPGAPRAVKS
jgi:hypothetical protein